MYKNAFQYKGRLSTISFLQKQVEKNHDNLFGTPVDLSTIDDETSSLNAVQIEEKEEEADQRIKTTKKTKLQKFSSLFTQSVPDTYVEFKRQREIEKKCL